MSDMWDDPDMRGLYPDLAAEGGLAAMLEQTARTRARDIGSVLSDFPGARIKSDRGVISIALAKYERMFLVGIHVPGFTWATGATDDVESLVDAVSAWRGGMSLDDFQAAFGFMQLDAFARALESRDVTALQWSDVLSDDFYEPHRAVLSRIHADEKLRAFFPTVSHGVIRLRLDALGTGVRGHILISHGAGGFYGVEVVGEPEADRVLESVDDLVGYLRDRTTAD